MSRRRLIQENVDPVKKIQEDIQKERKEQRRNRRRKFFKRLLMMMFIIVLGVGLYFFDQSEYSKVREIEVKGQKHLPVSYILDNLDINENDRLVEAAFKKYFNKPIMPGVANNNLKLYYTKGLISLTVQEYPVVGYIQDNNKQVLFSDNTLVENPNFMGSDVPKLVNFKSGDLETHPDFADKLSRMETSSFNSISEIHIVEEPLEDIYFKLIMNNGYFVFTNLKNLLLMDYYSDIVSGIQTGNTPENRCIYFLDYGHTPDNQSAVARPCDE